MRGIAVQGVGTTNKRTTKKGGHVTVLTEHHYTQPQITSLATTTTTLAESSGIGSTQVIVTQAAEDDGRTLMINTLKPAKTKLGKERIRMKWTTEVNEFILRTYYAITNMETQCKHYRDTLHRMFNEEFPDVEVCAQRIADQRRAIVKNHLLTQERIDEIRREVAMGIEGGHAVTSAPIMVSAPLVTMSKAVTSEPPQTMTVWYGCVKEEQRDADDGYSAGPSSNKLRRLNHEGSLAGGQSQQQQQQPQHIIIHTTGALGIGPHTITTTADALRR